jgi:site-specific recombinase XerD
MVERAGRQAKLAFKAHPHMLRHACGYALANKGHDTRALQAYLGHKNIQHTVQYTELSRCGLRIFGVIEKFLCALSIGTPSQPG